ncbi:hypothetical protein IAD21_05003 [Abditibacteriota bacterium]|nr:hypothetical protein IAD21_05003 [Abditibacteriota bacterium]
MGALNLQNSHSVSEQVRAQITFNYQKWKGRQSEDVTQVERFMALYAEDAQIFCAPGNKVSRDDFQQIIIEMRHAGYFSSVFDQKPLQWAQNSRGDEVELLAFHLYLDDSNNRLWGERRLVWQKWGKQWLIIRDDFPPLYLTDEIEPVIKHGTVEKDNGVSMTSALPHEQTAQDRTNEYNKQTPVFSTQIPTGSGF